MTSDFIALCIDHDIPVTMVDAYGTPVWRTEAFQGGSVPLLRRKQMILSEYPEGVTFVQAILDRKLTAQAALLKKLASNRRNDIGKGFRAQANKIEEIRTVIHTLDGKTIQSLRPSLLGLEGTAGRVYFFALKKILPDNAGFCERGRGEGTGPFNQMLNYGYGVLYQEVLRSCEKARLDPYIGVMHTDGYNRPALVYDLVEPFRTSVDKVVCKLFARRQIRVDEHFAHDQGLCLSKNGKQLLLKELFAELKSGPKLQIQQLVSNLAKDLAGWTVLGKGETA